MPAHAFLLEDLGPDHTGPVTITGEEAAHAARSKRLRTGEFATILNGRGLVALARIAHVKRDITLDLLELRTEPRQAPHIHILSATPKGPRLDKMIDMLSQAGAASWSPLDTALGVVDPGDTKLERIARICAESAKQCRRPWLMDIGDTVKFAHAVERAPHHPTLLADHGGSPVPAHHRIAESCTILIGPEGGWHDSERSAAARADIPTITLGPHQMRIETAAVAAVAAVFATRPTPASDPR